MNVARLVNAGAASSAAPLHAAGRKCPVDYCYDASVFARASEFAADALYVVGGLYGNLAAFEVIERLAAAESGPVTIVFNGDFHWFDTDDSWFADIERGVAPHRALRGNVETEIVRLNDIGAGCGCAYPSSVGDDVVRRSNDMLGLLRQTAMRMPRVRERLLRLPMHLVGQVGPLRIGIVHGDAVSLAGWRFAHDLLDAHGTRAWLAEIKHASKIDVFASTHTCSAALRDFSFPHGRITVLNNGAAGMANFCGTRFGLLSRISTRPSPHPVLYGLVRDGVHLDTIAIDFDLPAFLHRFLKCWPEGSPAHASYYRRILDGPDYMMTQARGSAPIGAS